MTEKVLEQVTSMDGSEPKNDFTLFNDKEQELARLAAIVASSNDAIIGKTLEGIVTSWNNSAERIYGYTAGEMLGRPINIVVPQDRRKELETIVGKIKSGKRVKNLETVRRRKDGVQIDISLTISPIRDGNGKLLGASSITRDITEHKDGERRNHAIRELLQLFVRATCRRVYLNEILELIRRWCRCEAAGMDVPGRKGGACLEAQIGFSEDFLKVQKSLFEQDPRLIFKGNTDGIPNSGTFRFFTPGGSFLCDDITDEACQLGSPGLGGLERWIKLLTDAGYRSAGIIPVRYGSDIKGTVIVADRGTGRISSRFFDFIEAMVPVIGDALYRFDLEEERCRAETALRNSEKGLAEAQRLAKLGSWTWNIADGGLSWSKEIYRIFGLDSGSFTPNYDSFFDRVHPDEKEVLSHAVNRTLYENVPFEMIHRILRADGSERIVRELGRVERDESGTPVSIMGTVQDITEYEKAKEELEKLSLAVEQASDWILITDRNAHTVFVNEMVETISGYDRDELLGENPRIIKSDRHDDAFYRELWVTISAGKPYRAVFINRKKNESLFYLDMTITPVRDRLGAIAYYVSTAKDITQEKILKERLDYMAYYDLLTGLPNRSLFLDRMNQAIARAEHNGRLVAVCTLDIDRFKLINEAYGPQKGDEVLKEIGRRLFSVLREGDTVARLGSDEFGLLIMDLARITDVIPLIDKLMKKVSEPVTHGSTVMVLTASVGIAIFPDDGTSSETLLRNSDSAFITAKKQGRNLYQFYTRDLNIRAAEFLKIEQQLFKALKNEEFVLHFQPYYLVDTTEIVGMEALVRWNSPELGLVPPGRFIPVLEETGMIIEVGEWILKAACEQIVKWSASGIDVPRVSVNLSGVQFRQKDLVDRIKAVLAGSSVSPKQLTFELTETTFISDIEFTGEVLGRLKEMGAHIAIDDFGTGYSSMNYLKRLPVNILKIDISFIREIADDPDSTAIVMAMISMAHALNMKTVAEGVETKEQWKLLRLLRCDMIQGYYFSRPLPAEELEKLLLAQKESNE